MANKPAHRPDVKSANLPAFSQDDAAELLKASPRTVRHATVVLDNGAPELVEAVERGADLFAELRSLLAGQFAKWQCPDDIVVVSALPRGSTGKVDKIRLRGQAPAGT